MIPSLGFALTLHSILATFPGMALITREEEDEEDNDGWEEEKVEWSFDPVPPPFPLNDPEDDDGGEKENDDADGDALFEMVDKDEGLLPFNNSLPPFPLEPSIGAAIAIIILLGLNDDDEAYGDSCDSRALSSSFTIISQTGASVKGIKVLIYKPGYIFWFIHSKYIFGESRWNE